MQNDRIGKVEGRKRGEEEEEQEEEEEATIELLQDEVLCTIFSHLDTKTLMLSIPQVCRVWRAVCQDMVDMHLDLGSGINVPVEVFAGWKQTPFMMSSSGGGG